MATLDVVIGALGIFAALAAATLWWWASVIEVPDNIDTFIAELQRISRINAWGARPATIAALCAAYASARDRGWIA